MDVAEPDGQEAVVPAQRDPAPSTPAVPSTLPTLPRRRPPGRLRTILLTGLLIGALGAVGAIGYGFIWYDQATKLDRSAPDVAVDNYLRALLVERDDTAASLYVCRDSPALDEIRALRDDTIAREQRFNITFRVTWGSLTVRTEGERTQVTTRLILTITDGSEESAYTWRFETVDQDGWRVCGATKVD